MTDGSPFKNLSDFGNALDMLLCAQTIRTADYLQICERACVLALTQPKSRRHIASGLEHAQHNLDLIRITNLAASLELPDAHVDTTYSTIDQQWRQIEQCAERASADMGFTVLLPSSPTWLSETSDRDHDIEGFRARIEASLRLDPLPMKDYLLLCSYGVRLGKKYNQAREFIAEDLVSAGAGLRISHMVTILAYMALSNANASEQWTNLLDYAEAALQELA